MHWFYPDHKDGVKYAVIDCGLIVFLGLIIYGMIVTQCQLELDKEALKAGLIQKVIPSSSKDEHSKVIWTQKEYNVD